MKGTFNRSAKTNGSGSNTSSPSQSLAPVTNGHRRSNSRHNGSFKENSPSQFETTNTNRLVNLLKKASGQSVVATTSAGAKYRGILLGVDLSTSGNSALSVVLAKPTLVGSALAAEKTDSSESLPDRLVIQAKDLIDIDVTLSKAHDKLEPAEASGVESESSKPAEKAVSKPAEKSEAPAAENGQKSSETPKPTEKLPAAEKPKDKPYKLAEILAASPAAARAKSPQAPAKEQKFKTDSDISSGFQVRERELQRWVPDAETPELSLEDNSNATWDQFKVNEEKFGVESSYDEHLYTTRINTSAADYQTRLRRAEKLAKEIEGQASTDRHVLEERGAQVDDSGMDEEDKYSGVIGDSVDTRGVELMAALRNASITSERPPAAPSAGNYVTPRQRAAQYHNDPAIVSSSATQAPLSTVATPPASEAEPKTDASKPSSIPPKPQLNPPQGESFRLNAKSEINALKEFSANFKVPHRMPNDLLPILAKDKIKQDEILRKLDSTKKSVSPQHEGKKDLKSFKLNPKAAAFTPSSKPGQQSPVPPKASFSRSPNNPSPRMHNQRPYSTGSSSSGNVKRHYQITPAEFFGGADKVPTAANQKEKIQRFKNGFNLFATAKRNHKDESTPLVFEKAFHTPPTWASTVDESYDKLLAQLVLSVNKTPSMMPSPGMPYMPSPLMVSGSGPQMGAGGFPGAPGGNKFSPHMASQASMAAHFQQQQFQAAMLYQQFQGGIPQGQPQMMFDNQFVPPQFIAPGFVSPGSPAGGNMMNPYGGAMNNQGHQGNYNQNRRYNNSHSQKPRGGHA